MIPSTVSGRIRYYLRIHDKTVTAPDYLISDLVLGRRQIPQLSLTDIHGARSSSGNAFGQSGEPFEFAIVANVENDSLTWAEHTRIGIIGWTLQRPKGVPEISRNLRSYVNVTEPDYRKLDEEMFLRHYDSIDQRLGNSKTMAPFDTWAINLPGKFEVVGKRYYKWKAAVYIVAKNMPPVWYQITGPGHRFWDSLNNGNLEHERMVSERPTISFGPD